MSFILFIILLGGTFITISKTSIAAIGITGLLALILAISNGSVRPKSQLGSVKMTILAILFIIATFVIGGYLKEAKDLETLTGRTNIWESSIDFIEKTPLFGRGIGSVATITSGSRLLGIPNVNHLHNQLIQTLFEYGTVGLAFEIAMYVSFLFICLSISNRARRRSKGDWQTLTTTTDFQLGEILCYAIFTMQMIRSLAEASIFSVFSPTMCILLSAMFLETYRKGLQHQDTLHLQNN